MVTVMVKTTEILLIVLAILLAPFYGLWIAGGMLADRMERRRRSCTSKRNGA